MKRLFVSGANGFLGSNIIRIAVTAGIEVVAITSGDKAVCDVKCIKTSDFLKDGYSFNSDDVFINCMFPTNANGFKMADGLNKVYRLISVCSHSKVGAFINISSQSVYDPVRTTPAKEDDSLCTESAYAVGKYSTEVLCNELLRDIPHTNIRLASLIGVGYEQRIINRLVRKALAGENLGIVGGMQRYGFLDVRDAAEGILVLALSDPITWGTVYNLGTNESVTLTDVALNISELMKKNAGINVSFSISEGTDNRNSSLDASRFMSDFGWSPKKNVYQTTEDIIQSIVESEEK